MKALRDQRASQKQKISHPGHATIDKKSEEARHLTAIEEDDVKDIGKHYYIPMKSGDNNHHSITEEAESSSNVQEQITRKRLTSKKTARVARVNKLKHEIKIGAIIN